MVIIYCLEKCNKIFYVGKTKNSILREQDHKNKYGNDINFIPLDEVEDNKNEWKFWESYWIDQFKAWGFNLLNKNKGGGGLVHHTELSKLKISLSKKGKKQSPQTCIKKSIKMKEGGAYKISRANSNPSIETRQKMSKAKLGVSNIMLSKAKLGVAHIKIRKPILQYDLEGNFIKEWESASLAINELKCKGIPNALTGISKTANNSIWKYKTT
jgi:hypothetical protein